MIGEIIQYIYKPKDESGWFLIKTNQGFYSMRLGGFKKETGLVTLGNYEKIVMPYESGEVMDIYTDEEWVYLVLSNGNIVVSGWTEGKFGDANLGIKFTKLNDYDDVFFQSKIFRRLTIGKDNWSQRV
jgi:hypothetical protein